MTCRYIIGAVIHNVISQAAAPLLSVLLYLLHVSVDNGHGSDVDNIAYAALEVGEVYRLVKTHLDRTNNLSVRIHCTQQLVCVVGTAEVREHKRVDILALKARERILGVAQLVVESKVYLHLAVDGQVWITCLHSLNGSMNLSRTAYLVGTEV